jgi:hypothetical protein
LAQEGRAGMDISWVILRRDSKKWILIASLAFVATLAIYEVCHPGTLWSIFKGIIATIAQIGSYFEDIVNSLGEVVRNISGWLH